MSDINTDNKFNRYSEGDINTGIAREEWVEKLESSVKSVLETDAGSFIWQNLSTPCLDVIASCEGPYIFARNGRKILDFHGNNIHQVGYKNKSVIDAVKKQMDILPFSPRRFTNEIAVNFAGKLLAKTSGTHSRVLFSTGGASANSIALKLARIKTNRHKVVSMWGSFHGAGLDTISVGGEAIFRKGIGPLLPGVIHVPSPDSYRTLWKNDPEQHSYVDYIRYVFEHEGDVGALIAETIRNTDIQVPAKQFWQKVRALCTEFDVTLILDEIPISLGRTGKFFAYEHYNIVPDIITLGKGLGGGIMPVGAVLATEEYNITAGHSVGHFTHEKSPLASAAGSAVLDYIDERKILLRVRKLEEYMRDRCYDLYDSYQMVGDVRGIGLLWGIELVNDRVSKERAVKETERIMYSCLENGLNFKVSKGNVITLSPSLIITKAELCRAFDILEDAFSKFLKI